jgi:hypothetical protein
MTLNKNIKRNNLKINYKINFFEKAFEEINIGEFVSLLDMISIYSSSKKMIFSGFFYNLKDSLKLQNYTFGNLYSGVPKYSKLKIYEEIVFLGFNPRFDATLLNICFARLKENNDIKFSSIGPAFENFFSVQQQGNHGYSLLNVLEGRSIKNFRQRFERFSKIFYSLGLTSIANNSISIMKFFNTKFYESPLFISPEMGLINFLEIFGGMSLQNYLLAESYEKTLLRKLQFNFDINYSKKNKTQLIDKYDFEVHDTSFNVDVSQINLKFPLTSFYEQSNWILNIFGNVGTSQRSMNNLISKTNSISEWLLGINTIAIAWGKTFKKIFFRGKKNKKRIALLNFLKDIKNPFIYNKLYTYNIFWSLYNTNKQEIINNFKNIQYKDFSLNYIYNSPFEINIFNFYTSTKLSKYSSTMVKLSYIYPSHCLLK